MNSMEKAETLPRTRKNGNTISPSTSLISLKSKNGDKFKLLPLIRKKKKKKSDTHLEVSIESKTDVSDSEQTSQNISPASTLSSLPTAVEITSSSSNVNENVGDIASNVHKSPKIGKRSKEKFKNVIKNTKNLLPIFKNKNESVPVAVENTLDIRRVTLKEDDDNNEMKEDVENNFDKSDIEEEIVQSKDDWSVTATCARVKRLSSFEIVKDSVYINQPDQPGIDEYVDSISPDTTPDQETNIKYPTNTSNSAIPVQTPDANGLENPPNFNKKSPNTLKKEILQITKRKTSAPEHDYIVSKVLNRNLSRQDRISTDKNELLFKILVIGELGTGKTSIIKRYVHQFFSQHYRATIGVDFALKVLSWDENTTIRLQLWDIAGQERFGNMTRVYYKEAVGAFIVFDVTRVGTFEAVTKWKQDLDSKVQLPGGQTIPCVLLANKCDQPKEGVVHNHHKMDEFSKENQFIAWFETSAKDNINIDEAANCLVTKIIQNDLKKQQEKEINGTSGIPLNLHSNDKIKQKFCNFC